MPTNSPFPDSAFISSIDIPGSDLLSFGNNQKSHGAKSVEYGGTRQIFAKWSRRTSEMLAGVLS